MLGHKPPAKSEGDGGKASWCWSVEVRHGCPLRHAGHVDPCCDLWGPLGSRPHGLGPPRHHLPSALANLLHQHPLNRPPASPGPCLCFRHHQALWGSCFTLLKPCCPFPGNVLSVKECYLKNLQHSIGVKCEKISTLFSKLGRLTS